MTSPMRVLFTIPNFVTAGSGRALLNVVSRLDRSRFEPSICVLNRGGALESEIEALGIPLLEQPFTVPTRPLSKLPGYVRAAAQQFRPYRFDLWHSYHYGDDYTEPLIAYQSGARGWIYHKKNMSWGGNGWRLRSLLATRIAAQNTAMLNRFFNTPLYRSKVRLLPRGVETNKFKPGTPSRLNLRRQLGLEPEVPLLGMVAHLLRVKGHSLLFRAIVELPAVHLILAGKPLDAVYSAELESLGEELGIADRVHLLGEVSDVAALHAELDALILPTRNKGRMEGCPLALLEGMASGLPCIATEIPGSSDLIVDGECGLLVEPDNSAALAGAISRLLESPEERRRLGRAARERIEAAYTIEQEVDGHQELYDSLMRWEANLLRVEPAKR